MASLNKIILIGHVEADADVKATQAGDPVANFKLRVERQQRTEGMPIQTDIVPVVAWHQNAEVAGSFKQGDLLLVEGRILTRSYDNAEGMRVYVTEVDARTVKPLTSASSATDLMQSQPAQAAAPVSEPLASAPQPSPAAAPIVEQSKPKDLNFDFSDSISKDVLDKMPSLDEPMEEDVPF